LIINPAIIISPFKLTDDVSFFKLKNIGSFLINLAVTERCTSTQRTHHFLATFSEPLLDLFAIWTYVNSDCTEIDELLLQMADYKNDLADMAAGHCLKVSRERRY